MLWKNKTPKVKDTKLIFIDVDDTVRETLQSMLDFTAGLGDSLISENPVLFKSGTPFETYYYNFPQIAASASMASGALHYVSKFRNELHLHPIFISAQKQITLQDITTTWLKDKGFIEHDQDVHYTYNMQGKDIYIGKLGLKYKPILLDNFNFVYTKFAKHLRMGINKYNRGYAWDPDLFATVKSYYAVF